MTQVLGQVTSDVDSTGRSYYGESNLIFMDVNSKYVSPRAKTGSSGLEYLLLVLATHPKRRRFLLQFPNWSIVGEDGAQFILVFIRGVRASKLSLSP